MPGIIQPKFELTNTHDDYIEFVVSYVIDQDYWRASGIGWVKKSSPKYYIRVVRLNGKLTPESAYKNARVSLKNTSYEFKDKSLNALVSWSILQEFKISKPVLAFKT